MSSSPEWAAADMGNCFGKCFSNSSSKSNLYENNSTRIDFNFLIENEQSRRQSSTKRSFLSRLFYRKPHCYQKNKPVLNLVDELLHPQLTAYNRLHESQCLPSTGSGAIQLQSLDARALLARTATSTPTGSLDLEWEHETLPISMIHEPSGSWTILGKNSADQTSPQNTGMVLTSDSDWSRVSSANSLEWDNVQNLIDTNSPTEIDADTQFLLGEIERLTNQTLRETGHDLFS